MTIPALRAQGLTFQYASGSTAALLNVDLEVSPGEMLLVAGPSGCGKSTLLKCFNGLVPHSYKGRLEGKVELFGELTTNLQLQQISSRVGTVLQDPDKQLVAATVGADLAFGPENEALPRDEIRRRIDEVAETLSLTALLDRPTAALSGGERQKVALAGVLAMRPQVMLLDEPLASLDPATAMELLEFLREQTRDGLAVVVVEHRVEDVLQVEPNRVVYMEKGQVRYDGNASGFLRRADPSLVKLPFDPTRRPESAKRSDPSAAAGGRRGRRPTEAHPLVQYDHVSFGYPSADSLAVRDVTTTLASPERVAVLGPNGSGKSTMMKLALRLIEPTAGQVVVNGRPTSEQTVAELARQVAYVFQSPRQMLFANTVREELAFAPRNLGKSAEEAAEIARAALARVGLDREDGIWERSPYALSFGQQKRLAIAAALTLKPRAIIVDEPSAGQDYGHAAAFLGETDAIEDLESLYFITHDVDLALLYSDRCLLVREGGLEVEGAPLRVLADVDRLKAFRLRPTSLLAANLRWLPPGASPLDADGLYRRLQTVGGVDNVDRVSRS